MANSKQVFDAVALGGARSITDLDAAIGQRIKKRRTVLGLTQWQLADQINISFQQLYKYEAGINRVPAQRLHEIARALGAPLEYFFDDTDEKAARAGTSKTQRHGPRRLGPEADIEGQIRELVDLFRSMRTEESRTRLLKLVRFYTREME